MDRAEPARAGFDALVERASRWTASRTTRRGFLGRLGRAGVLVAGGPTMALMLSRADVAEARVCGQSGVAPKCSTFDCNGTIGWCWYATGCCAEGRLKKICDCCAPNTPHPVGYCPSGTRVLCIWESCGADPRLQTRTILRWRETGTTALSLEVSGRRFPESAPMAVIGDAQSPGFAGIASSLGRVVDGPVLLSSRAGLTGGIGAELERLGVEFVKVAGPRLAPTIDAELVARGLDVERIGGLDPDIESFSAAVSGWSRAMTGGRMAIVVVPGPAERAVPAAAGVANGRRWPLLVGTGPAVQAALREPRPVRTTWVVTHDPDVAQEFPGGRAVSADDLVGLSAAVAEAGAQMQVPLDTISLAPEHDDDAAAGLATMPGPLLRYHPGRLDGIREWLFAHRAQVQTAHVAGIEQDFGNAPYYELQSILNRYETHLLQGQAGEGLPVIPQPRHERPVGQARE